MMQLMANGPSGMALTDIMRRVRRLGINIDADSDFGPDDKIDEYDPRLIK